MQLAEPSSCKASSSRRPAAAACGTPEGRRPPALSSTTAPRGGGAAPSARRPGWRRRNGAKARASRLVAVRCLHRRGEQAGWSGASSRARCTRGPPRRGRHPGQSAPGRGATRPDRPGNPAAPPRVVQREHSCPVGRGEEELAGGLQRRPCFRVELEGVLVADGALRGSAQEIAVDVAHRVVQAGGLRACARAAASRDSSSRAVPAASIPASVGSTCGEGAPSVGIGATVQRAWAGTKKDRLFSARRSSAVGDSVDRDQ